MLISNNSTNKEHPDTTHKNNGSDTAKHEELEFKSDNITDFNKKVICASVNMPVHQLSTLEHFQIQNERSLKMLSTSKYFAPLRYSKNT